MVSFLFITSFLIHIVTIYALVQIYFKYESLKKTEKTDSSETIELLETYLQEMKEENNRLQNLIDENQRIKNSNPVKKEDNIRIPNKIKTEDSNNDLNDMNDFPILDNNINDTLEASLEAKVLQLHNQGVSITDIARQLHCGKTEAELIINLNEKNKDNS